MGGIGWKGWKTDSTGKVVDQRGCEENETPTESEKKKDADRVIWKTNICFRGSIGFAMKSG